MKFQNPYKLRDLAKLINAEYIGDPELIISGLNEIHKTEKGDITFVDHPKYYEKTLNSNATAIIINKEIPAIKNKGLLFSKDPFRDFVKIIREFRNFEQCNDMISKKALIGQGTIIQPGVFIGHNVIIGRNCLIHANVSIYDHSIIGDNVIIHSGSIIGADAFYYKKREDGHYDKLESCGRAILEDDVEIGALSSVDKGVSGDTIIGKGSKLDNHIQIGHDTVIGKNVIISSHATIAGVTEVGDNCIIWGQVAINKDVKIGDNVILLATSGVDKSLEGGKTYFGVPAEEARKKWKEIAYIRKLPELFAKLKV